MWSSDIKIGDLMSAHGEAERAVEQYRSALPKLEKLTADDPKNSNLSEMLRELTIKLHTLELKP